MVGGGVRLLSETIKSEEKKTKEMRMVGGFLMLRKVQVDDEEGGVKVEEDADEQEESNAPDGVQKQSRLLKEGQGFR